MHAQAAGPGNAQLKERTAEIAQRRARAERCLRHLVQRRLAAAFNSWHSNAAIAKG